MQNTNINKWVKIAQKHPIPILQYTIKELRYLCSKANIPIREITHVVERDPGLVIHVLRTANNRRKGRLSAEITHVNQAFHLMGTDQLTKLPDALPAIGDVLDDKSKVRLLETFDRAYHAARFATDFAFLRRDMVPDEVFAAAQLHFLGEMLISIHDHELLEKIAKLRVEKHITSEEAQYMVLGFTLNELTIKISERLKFPKLVTEALQLENARYPRAYGIMLGVQLARNISYEGWYSELTYKIQKETADWMDWSVDEVISRNHTIAAEVARETPQYDTLPVARLLPLIIEKPIEEEEEESVNAATVCLMPQPEKLNEAVSMMKQYLAEKGDRDKFIQKTVTAMHDGIGLSRVAFYMYNKEGKSLHPYSLKGTENDPVFNRYAISHDGENIFSRLLNKTQAVSITDENREKYWTVVPEEFQKIIVTNSFVAMSVFIKGEIFGMFYADRHSPICQIDEQSYNFFKTLCVNATKVLRELS